MRWWPRSGRGLNGRGCYIDWWPDCAFEGVRGFGVWGNGVWWG